MTGGYWHDFYEPTAEELAESARRQQESARRGQELAQQQKEYTEAAAAASTKLARARGATEIAQVIQRHRSEGTPDHRTLAMFDEASCLSAWRVLVQSDTFPATHDLVHWKARYREWQFYCRSLPSHVVRATRRPREPVWKVPGIHVWVCTSGSLYWLAEPFPRSEQPSRPEIQDGLLDVGWIPHGKAVVPCGERFRTEHRRRNGDGTPEHYVVGGFNVGPHGSRPSKERVAAHHLALFLSQ